MENNNNYLAGSVSSSFARLFLRTAQDYGIAPREALDACHLNLGILDNSLSRIDSTEFETLMRWLIIQTDDELFGFNTAKHLVPGALGLLGYLIMNCQTGGDAIRLVPKYEGLIGNLGHTELTEKGDVFSIRWQCSCTDDLVAPHLIDEFMSTTAEYARWVTGRNDIAAHCLYLERSEPNAAQLQKYRDHYRCDIIFDAGVNLMEFNPQFMSLPLNHPYPTLLKTLQEQADRQSKELQHTDPIVVQVRTTLANMMETSIPRRERVASKLGMSERTLQRRLLEAESSYQQILDTLRLQLSKEWLLRKNWPISEVAVRLGFTEPRSFQRRFKTWTGMSPGEYRKQRLPESITS